MIKLKEIAHESVDMYNVYTAGVTETLNRIPIKVLKSISEHKDVIGQYASIIYKNKCKDMEGHK